MGYVDNKRSKKSHQESISRDQGQVLSLGISRPQESPLAIAQRAEKDLNSLTPADIIQLQKTLGNAAVGQLLETSAVQAKTLNIEHPVGNGIRKSPMQQKSIPNNTGMPNYLKAGLESLSGFDLSDARVHYDSGKPARVGAQMQGRVRATTQSIAGITQKQIKDVTDTTSKNHANFIKSDIVQLVSREQEPKHKKRGIFKRGPYRRAIHKQDPYRKKMSKPESLGLRYSKSRSYGPFSSRLYHKQKGSRFSFVGYFPWLGRQGVLLRISNNIYWAPSTYRWQKQTRNTTFYPVINGIPQVPADKLILVEDGFSTDEDDYGNPEYSLVLQMHAKPLYAGQGGGHAGLINCGYVGPIGLHTGVVGITPNDCLDTLPYPAASKLAWGAHHQGPNPPPVNSVVHRVQANLFRNAGLTRAFAKLGPVVGWCATYLANTAYKGPWNMHHWMPLAWDGQDANANLTPLPTKAAGGIHDTHAQWHAKLKTGGGKMYPQTYGSHYKRT